MDAGTVLLFENVAVNHYILLIFVSWLPSNILHLSSTPYKKKFQWLEQAQKILFHPSFSVIVPCRIGPYFSHPDSSLASVWHLRVYEDLTYMYSCMMWSPILSDWHQDFHFKHNETALRGKGYQLRIKWCWIVLRGSVMRHIGLWTSGKG